MLDLGIEEPSASSRVPPSQQILDREPLGREFVGRQVHPITLVILPEIPKDVGQLKGFSAIHRHLLDRRVGIGRRGAEARRDRGHPALDRLQRLANGPQLPAAASSQEEIDRLLASFD